MITSKTKLIGIFGDPIEQTLSPAIQNAALAELGLDMVYVPFHIPPEGLEGAIEAVRALDMAGVNITIPHKEKVMAFLDEITEEARNIGAVNTVVNKDGKLIGHNTDGAGYVKSLSLETSFDLEGKNVVLIGAGGAARGILSAVLNELPKRVTIANRTLEKAQGLASDFAEKSKIEIKAVPIEKDSLLEYIKEADLLVNSTSLGMGAKVPFNTLVLSLDKAPKEMIVSDIVYKPLDTALLKSARREGLKVHKGLGMLIHQGALGFELWTGEKPSINVMTKAALDALDIK
ncbi:MAG: shikimate dehydrogenase [Thermodesulfobacteriota bacterium]